MMWADVQDMVWPDGYEAQQTNRTSSSYLSSLRNFLIDPQVPFI